MPDPAAKNQLLWPRIEWSEFQGLGPVSTVKSHEVRVGQWGVGSFTKKNQGAFTIRRIGGAGRHKQRCPLYLPNIFCIFVVILTPCSPQLLQLCSCQLWSVNLHILMYCVLVAQSCLTLCDPMDCSLPGTSVHGILQARILEWVSFPFCRDFHDPGLKPMSPALQADSLPSEPPLIVHYLPHKWKSLSRVWLCNIMAFTAHEFSMSEYWSG